MLEQPDRHLRLLNDLGQYGKNLRRLLVNGQGVNLADLRQYLQTNQLAGLVAWFDSLSEYVDGQLSGDTCRKSHVLHIDIFGVFEHEEVF
jgi:hypothetical protein